MMDIQIFHCEETASWNSAVERCAWHDFYHLAEYHLLHKQEGQGILIVISEDEKTIAFPLLVRPIEEVGGLEDFSGYFDATSVYGYPGPITNAETDIRFLKQAGWVLGNILRDQKIISVFSRLHPILGNDKYVFVGAAIPIGETISIDLTLPEEQQTKLYRKNHQRDIKRRCTITLSASKTRSGVAMMTLSACTMLLWSGLAPKSAIFSRANTSTNYV